MVNIDFIIFDVRMDNLPFAKLFGPVQFLILILQAEIDLNQFLVPGVVFWILLSRFLIFSRNEVPDFPKIQGNVPGSIPGF